MLVVVVLDKVGQAVVVVVPVVLVVVVLVQPMVGLLQLLEQQIQVAAAVVVRVQAHKSLVVPVVLAS